MFKRLSPAKIQIQICLKTRRPGHRLPSTGQRAKRPQKLAIDLGANLVLNCASDRCHDAGVYHAALARAWARPNSNLGSLHSLVSAWASQTDGETDRVAAGRSPFGHRWATSLWHPHLANCPTYDSQRIAPAQTAACPAQLCPALVCPVQSSPRFCFVYVQMRC